MFRNAPGELGIGIVVTGFGILFLSLIGLFVKVYSCLKAVVSREKQVACQTKSHLGISD